MYLIKAPFLFNAMYTGMKPFIHEVTKAKFVFTGKHYYEEFIKQINPENIPFDYGGTGPSLNEIEEF